MSKSDEQINFKCSKAEKEQLKKYAKELRMPLSQFCRKSMHFYYKWQTEKENKAVE